MSAYWIARGTITDPDSYGKYVELASPVLKAHGGRYLVRGGELVVFEGSDHPRAVLVEFPTLEAARTCYNSAEYQDALKFAKGASNRDVCIVEGL